MASDFIIDDRGNALFDYSLRVSAKARYARLQIKPYSGLEVVIPTRFPKKAVPELIREHADWIKQQLGTHQQALQRPELPTGLYYQIDDSFGEVAGNNSDYDKQLDALRKLVRKKARDVLPPLLETVADHCGLYYQKVSIRSQKTRWGSCSSRGTISLNDQLVFMPVETVRYLMIHELCHTRYMNHSAKFWQLVESFNANYRYHESVLNRARAQIPEWFQYSLFR